jgi:curli biogenesis system outer membrane secretion channel CsgG
LIALSACGVETASTAATSAALKKQELEQGRQTLDRAEQKIDAATARMQERAQSDAGQAQ